MRPRTGVAAFATFMTVAGVLAATAAGAATAHASTSPKGGPGGHDQGQTRLIPGDLLVSTSYYRNDPKIVAGTTVLPPGCTSGCVTAIANGNYPQVFNNATVDGSFGVTSPLYLEEITQSGRPQGTIPVPTSELTTSFSSKSEGALNLSADGRNVTFIGYVAAPDTVDVSNANTPGVIDPTNPVPGGYYRAVAQLSADGTFTFTETNAYSGSGIESTLTSAGLASNMCILKGFPTALAKDATDASDYPFGLWFANPTTLYVADEGSGDNTYAGGTYTADAASTTAGLQKWVFNAAAGEWQLAYTLQSGLNLGAPYTVRGYPIGINSVTGLPWAPATDGLRNLTGRVNPNGTVSIWAVTSTVSGGGDQGADPNQLVEITDPLKATTPAGSERFRTVIPALYDQVVRGVSFTPGSLLLAGY